MPNQIEPSVNNALGILLQAMLSRSHVRSENTQTIEGHPGMHPDILVTAPGSTPVVLEAEYLPALNAETEAKDRLGLVVAETGRPIEAAIALRYPEEIGEADDLAAALKDARLSYCVFTETASQPDRFPESGWLEGSLEDVADMVRLASAPQRAVRAAADSIERGIERVARILDEMNESRQGINAGIARLLGMTNVPQTRRMACAIIANALVFHSRIAGMHDSVKPVNLVCGPGVSDPQRETLEAWTKILEINYWPVFAVGKDILAQLPANEAARILQTLQITAGEVSAAGVDNSHDLTGRVFQRLIADRKYLATFYTLPASAALLARLAVAKLDGVDWSDPAAIGSLHIGDFACGTGALLSAVYEQIAARHERAGGDPAALHRQMMEEVLYGCDVMPSAIHITGSTLSGAYPQVEYQDSRLYPLAYGRQADGSVAIGSLETLRFESARPLFYTGNPAFRVSGIGEEPVPYLAAEFPHDSFDMVIMNPPFTRATNHEGAHADITNPAFAAFDATREDQTAMGARINQMGKGSCYHGNAGIASAFAALAHRKLKPGGVLALVLPLSASAGLSWQGFRQMMATEYKEVTVLSIAANGRDMSFSSDTGIAECLVVARKLKPGETPGQGACFSSLTRRPQGFAHANAVAGKMLESSQVRQIEDGPYGGTPVLVGSSSMGETITAPCDSAGGVWGAVRISDYSLAQTAHALSLSQLWLPGSSVAVGLKVALLGEVGKLGFVHRDITGPAPRGPFTKMSPGPTATYPALWNHDAQNETKIVCAPDSQLQVRQGMEEKAATVWHTASRSHINLDFTFGSQAMAVAFTERESIGGRVWPNVVFIDGRFDYALAVWGNTTLGLLSHWWHSSRQQSSKAGMTIRSAESLPVLDFRTLSDEQLTEAETIFEEFRDKELKPAYLADADPNRAQLDRRVVCSLLGFDEDVYQGVRRLAAKWCAEPSVHGGKARPKGSDLVI